MTFPESLRATLSRLPYSFALLSAALATAQPPRHSPFPQPGPPDTAGLQTQTTSPPLVSGYQSEQPSRARHAMVVSVHHLATDAGVEVLRAGGNAVDAAVATGFALAVVYPSAGNVGGGGFMLLRLKSGQATFLDYREKAPEAATAAMYLDAKGDLIEGLSTVGYKASGVPGSVAGMVYAEKKYGRLSLKRVMAPAIRLARDGFVLTQQESDSLANKRLATFAETHRVFQHDGKLLKAGEFLRQPDLARTLSRIAADPDTFYRGAMAQEIAAAEKNGGGLITTEDLAAYEVKERRPLTGSYGNYTLLTAPPPSSGGIALLEALNILSGYNLSRLGDRTPESMHLIVEAWRRAYLDRTDFLGDPDFTQIPVEQLTSQRYADAWRVSIDADRATPSRELKRPEGFLPVAAARETAPRPEHAETTHYSVVDAEGNAVAVTTTLNGSYGSSVTLPGLGFLMNNQMDDFTSKPGSPNMYGLIQSRANAIGPGKRPLSSMTPTLVLEDNHLRMVLGSPGGPRITTTVGNILLSTTSGGLNIQQAVDAPRYHHQYLPDTLYLEPGFSASTTEGLRALGYSITEQQKGWSDGECIYVDPATGTLLGGQDHRSGYGKASGY